MRRILAVLSVAMMVAGAVMLAHPPKAHATQAPSYRCKITIGNVGICWAGGEDYPHGLLGGGIAMNTNGGPYFVYPGNSLLNGYIMADISPPCCDETLEIGTWTAQRSDIPGYYYDNGTPQPLVMVGGVEDVWDVNSDGTLDGGHVWVTCTGGTGGQ